jgi:hypothetical protein
MNINDVGELKELPDDMLGFIFAEQRKLMETYEKIEADNGLLTTSDIPVDLHDKMGQARLKDFAWRCTEEIAEALEAWDGNDIIHAKEEIADALHFLVEFTILAGVVPEDLDKVSSGSFTSRWDQFGKIKNNIPIEDTLRVFISHLGCTCNYLKNKPWKVSHMLTDVDAFKSGLLDTWVDFGFLAITFGIKSFEEMFQLYFRKSQVNEFRQRSNY